MSLSKVKGVVWVVVVGNRYCEEWVAYEHVSTQFTWGSIQRLEIDSLISLKT